MTHDHAKDLANARALGSALTAFLAVPWALTVCLYSGGWCAAACLRCLAVRQSRLPAHPAGAYTLPPPMLAALHCSYPRDKAAALRRERLALRRVLHGAAVPAPGCPCCAVREHAQLAALSARSAPISRLECRAQSRALEEPGVAIDRLSSAASLPAAAAEGGDPGLASASRSGSAIQLAASPPQGEGDAAEGARLLALVER